MALRSVQFVEDGRQQRTKPKDLTAFFMAHCTDDMTHREDAAFGMRLRLHMVQRLQADSSPDMVVECDDKRRVGQHHRIY